MTSLWQSCIPERFVSQCPTFVSLVFCLLLFVMSAVTNNLQAQTYTDMHEFNCQIDGCGVTNAGIVAQGRDGNLYSTLIYGANGPVGGAVFSITPTGTFHVVFTFNSQGTDGSGPKTGLTLGPDGNFYGATYGGPQTPYGTLFKITPAGVLTTLHTFTVDEAGGCWGPPVLGKNGTFYGVTAFSKAYSITSSGTFKLLPNPIPAQSRAPLTLASDGNFYGTSSDFPGGYGTVFQMSSAGKIKIIYNFDNTHGKQPFGPVVQGSDGYLYGTTAYGGSTGGGVVFKLSTKGVITVLHEFVNLSTTDGYHPVTGLVEGTDGNLYGNTSAGGNIGVGVFFKITKSGTYTWLYSFDGVHGGSPVTTQIQHT